jgi:predicted nucleotidyltransferase
MKKPESKLQELVTRLQQACGENLVSIVLYGSAAREDFHEEFSDVNVLVVLQHLEPSSFAAISAVLHWWSHQEKLRPPMIMTLEELRESADVFAIELLDI